MRDQAFENRHCEAVVADAHIGHPLVVLSTASPYKFPAAVLSALGETPPEDEFAAMERLHEKTGVPIPKQLAELKSQPVRHRDVIEKDEILEYVLRQVES